MLRQRWYVVCSIDHSATWQCVACEGIRGRGANRFRKSMSQMHQRSSSDGGGSFNRLCVDEEHRYQPSLLPLYNSVRGRFDLQGYRPTVPHSPGPQKHVCPTVLFCSHSNLPCSPQGPKECPGETPSRRSRLTTLYPRARYPTGDRQRLSRELDDGGRNA